MGTAVQVTRSDVTAATLRPASAKCTDGAQVRRILALALVLEGRPRTEAAALNGMDRQTLSDWVHRFNAEGIEGLKSRKSPGREPFLTAAQVVELAFLALPATRPAITAASLSPYLGSYKKKNQKKPLRIRLRSLLADRSRNNQSFLLLFFKKEGLSSYAARSSNTG